MKPKRMKSASSRVRARALRWCVWTSVVILSLAELWLSVRDAFNVERNYAAPAKARGIWAAVVSANMEREDVGAAPLWPADVRWGDPPVPVKWQSAAQYFRYLMSSTNYSGDPLLAVPAENPYERRVPDLELNNWAWPRPGRETPPSAFDDGQCRWHVCRIDEQASWETPFLISRNLHIEDGRIRKVGSGLSRVALDRVRLLESKRVFWITRGGSAYNGLRKRVTYSLLLPSTNEIEVITCR